MQLHEVVTTFDLPPEHNDYLNGFLEMGWGIIAIEQRRIVSGENSWHDETNYVLGAVSKLEHPAKYRAHLKALGALFQ